MNRIDFNRIIFYFPNQASSNQATPQSHRHNVACTRFVKTGSVRYLESSDCPLTVWVSAALTWDLQLIAECVRFESTQPGRVFLQVPWFLLKSTHGCCQFIHLPHKAFFFPLLKQLAAFRSQQFLHVFSKFLLNQKKGLIEWKVHFCRVYLLLLNKRDQNKLQTLMNFVRNIPWPPALRSPSEDCISSYMLPIRFLSKFAFSNSFFKQSHQSCVEQITIINDRPVTSRWQLLNSWFNLHLLP